MPSFELGPGVVVDSTRNEAYVMSPDGGIVALDIANGAQVWRTNAAAKPLGVAGSFLVSQAEPAGVENRLQIVTLDTGKQGAPVTRSEVELPTGVQPVLRQTFQRSFVANAQPIGGDAAVAWEFVERPLRGTPPSLGEAAARRAASMLPPGAAPAAAVLTTVASASAEPTVRRGAVRIGLPDGTVMPIAEHASAAPMAPAPATAHTPDTVPLPGVPEPQFRSVDGQHVLHSERVAHDPVWDKYLWTIYDRPTGKRLGAFRTHVRHAPFFVSDGRVIYQTNPYVRRTEAGLVETPLQIHAMNLENGKELWSQPVRDTKDRTPPPP